jgi:ribose transport system substrate-binding protein
VVAFDAEPAEVTALKAGTLDALVAQKAYQEGVDPVQLLWAHIHHKAIATSVNVGYVLMTKANLASTAKWEY